MLILTESAIGTGPIDQPYVEQTEIPCPTCGKFLDHYPEQDGACHSGLFYNHWEEHYVCENCLEEGKDCTYVEYHEELSPEDMSFVDWSGIPDSERY